MHRSAESNQISLFDLKLILLIVHLNLYSNTSNLLCKCNNLVYEHIDHFQQCYPGPMFNKYFYYYTIDTLNKIILFKTIVQSIKFYILNFECDTG